MDWSVLIPTFAAIGGPAAVGAFLWRVQQGQKKDLQEDLTEIKEKVDKINGNNRKHGESIAAINARCETRHESDMFMKRVPK